MGLWGDIEGIAKRQMVIFFLCEASDSMQGTKIAALNEALSELMPELDEAVGSDIEAKVAVLAFSNGCEWMYPTPLPIDSFQFKRMHSGGANCDLGEALKELNKRMSKTEFLAAPSASVAPAIFLFCDGTATDDFDSALNELKQNNWFKYAFKVAVPVGDEADKEMLAKFTGNIEAVITVHKPECIKKWLRRIDMVEAPCPHSGDYDEVSVKARKYAQIDEVKNIERIDIESNSDDW